MCESDLLHQSWTEGVSAGREPFHYRLLYKSIVSLSAAAPRRGGLPEMLTLTTINSHRQPYGIWSMLVKAVRKERTEDERLLIYSVTARKPTMTCHQTQASFLNKTVC